MKLTLIMPGVGRKEGDTYIDSWRMEPLVLAVLGGLTPPDVEVKAIDDRIEPIPYDEDTDLAAITVEAYTARRAYQIASEFRKRGVPVVLGGYHPTLMPEESIQYADSVVIGEAEGVWEQLISDARNNKLKRFYKSDNRPLLTGIKPRRDLFEGKSYMPLALVESARGCKFSCDFCSISAFYKSTHNWIPVKEVAKEVELLGRKNIFFVDDNITSNRERAKELFRELIPLKIRWISQADITIADDDELLTLMEKSGCVSLLIGFESLNADNLSQMGKSWNTSIGYESRLRKIREHRFKIYATFVFGYDNDNDDAFERTLEFSLKHKFFLAAFNHLMPFPGTSLYNFLAKENRLLYKKWWLDSGYHFGDIVFKPKQMTPEELSFKCIETKRRFYKYSSILRRFDIREYNEPFFIGVFFWLNFLLRKEVSKKQGIPIGEGLDLGK